jgi:triacylglycerol esterase/lipase EstA (alpha/beta hydrolase family)
MGFGGLSQRRRWLLVGVGATTAAALLVVGVAVVVSRVGGEGRVPPSQDRPGPVLLVPGFGGGVAGVTVLAGRLREAGRQAIVVRLPQDATGDLAGQARALDGYVEEALRGGASSVDVVGHSAGGVVARLWVERHDGPSKARRVVTLGSPHHGANLAAAGAAVAPGACPTACQQLAAGSRLLAGLRTPVPVPPMWLSLWTLQDQTVTPVESARLEGAVNVPVQSICPSLRVSHAALPTDPFVTGLVLAALGPEPLVAPQPRC